MKAKEWADKFRAVPATEEDVTAEIRYADVLAEFTKEIADLVAARTKGSTPETKYGAAEGAVREQQNKFRSICTNVPALAGVVYDALVGVAVPDFLKWKAAAEKKPNKRTGEDDVRDYRKQRERT